GTVASSPDDREAGDDEAAAADGPTAAPEAGSEAGGTRPAADPPGAEDAQPADLDKPTPAELSTGPVLQWTEIHPGVADLFRIKSVGDGRIIARTWRDTGSNSNTDVAEKVVVTTNGTDWAEVPMPAGVVPDRIDISGDRWLVAGPEAGADPLDRTPGRAFFSDDEGANWTELALGLPPGPAPASPYVIENAAVTSALVSGKNIVLVVSSGRGLDPYQLVEGRGLVPEGKTVVGWHSSRAGLIEFELADHGGTSGSITPFEDGSSPAAVERMPLTYDELGLTGEERAVFDDPAGGRVLVYASDGSAVDLVAEYEPWAWSGVATDQGFVLKVGGVRETTVTSRDGRAWSEQTPSWTGSSVLTLAPDGTIWMFGTGGPGLSIQRARYGETPTTAATFEDLQRTGNLAAGPAGLITTAAPQAAPEADLAAGIPEGRVAKGGYELRYNEPEFGVTLWDLEAGAAVYVFEAADIMSEEPPQGVREVSGSDGLQVVFEDPETGADLVTFTAEDLAPI
ncbi:MAG: hypothetical protein OXC00_03245, partial [Acidimicrobiaceae bacterium]|nr:hypothetical protein [Acidimicrobiaceae bacterium]